MKKLEIQLLETYQKIMNGDATILSIYQKIVRTTKNKDTIAMVTKIYQETYRYHKD